MSQDASSKAAELYGQTRAGPVIPDVPRTIRTRPVLNSGPLAPSNCNDVESAVGVLRCVRGALVCTRRAGASGGHDRAGARRTGGAMRPRASRRASRSGSACRSSTSPTGTPTGRTRATPGLPTTLSWTLPAGVTAGEIDWPTPGKLPVGPLVNYRLQGTVLLPVPVTVPAGLRRPGARGQAARRVAGLQGCLHPGAGRVHAARAGAAPPPPATARPSTPRAPPRRKPWPARQRRAEVDGDDAARVASAACRPPGRARRLAFFPETAGVIEQRRRARSALGRRRLDRRTCRWTRSAATARRRCRRCWSPAGATAGVQVALPVAGAWPALAAPGAAAAATAGAAAAVAAPPRTARWACGLAPGLRADRRRCCST